MAANARTQTNANHRPRVERAPIMRVWAWLDGAATSSKRMCPAHYVAFSCLKGGLEAGRSVFSSSSNGQRLGRAQRQWSRQPFPVSSTRRIIGEHKANIKENFCSRNPFPLNAWLSRTISLVCSLLALFSRVLLFVSNQLQPLFGKRGVGYLVAKFRLTS